MIKGQNLRVLIGDSCVGGATTCTLNTTANTEESSTKDSTADWTEEECVSKSWDVSSESLIEAVVDLGIALRVGETVALKFQETDGNKNQATKTKIFKGTAIISGVTITATNKQNGTKTVNFKGVGPLETDNDRTT